MCVVVFAAIISDPKAIYLYGKSIHMNRFYIVTCLIFNIITFKLLF